MSKDKRPVPRLVPEPEPMPTRAERDKKVDDARIMLEQTVVQLATQEELSAAEIFWVVTSIIERLSVTAKDAEQDEFYGKREKAE